MDVPTSTATPSGDAAIVSAYEQAETTYVDLEEIPQDNAAAYAELQRWFVNPALTSHIEQLEVYVADGERLSGTNQLGSPIVTTVDGGTAQLQSCEYWGATVVEITSGQSAEAGQVAGYVLDSATLVLQNGAWLVSVDGPATYEGANGCTAASPSP